MPEGARIIVGSIEAEYWRYKALAEGAIAQMGDEQLHVQDPSGSNSVAILMTHLGGNLASRFTDFLTSDGEKPWRDRDKEFEPSGVSRQELTAVWERGWAAFDTALAPMIDDDLYRQVVIRRTPMAVHEALLRLLAHTSYHVGQIVYIARMLRSSDWRWLSIPPGESATYNMNPTSERAAAHTASLREGGAEK